MILSETSNFSKITNRKSKNFKLTFSVWCSVYGCCQSKCIVIKITHLKINRNHKKFSDNNGYNKHAINRLLTKNKHLETYSQHQTQETYIQ